MKNGSLRLCVKILHKYLSPLVERKVTPERRRERWGDRGGDGEWNEDCLFKVETS